MSKAESLQEYAALCAQHCEYAEMANDWYLASYKYKPNMLWIKTLIYLIEILIGIWDKPLT